MDNEAFLILVDLVAEAPFVDEETEDHVCYHCGYWRDENGEHEPDCVWERARKYLDSIGVEVKKVGA